MAQAVVVTAAFQFITRLLTKQPKPQIAPPDIPDTLGRNIREGVGLFPVSLFIIEPPVKGQGIGSKTISSPATKGGGTRKTEIATGTFRTTGCTGSNDITLRYLSLNGVPFIIDDENDEASIRNRQTYTSFRKGNLQKRDSDGNITDPGESNDPVMVALLGDDLSIPYRGLATLVFDKLPLNDPNIFEGGNSYPQDMFAVMFRGDPNNNGLEYTLDAIAKLLLFRVLPAELCDVSEIVGEKVIGYYWDQNGEQLRDVLNDILSVYNCGLIEQGGEVKAKKFLRPESEAYIVPYDFFATRELGQEKPPELIEVTTEAKDLPRRVVVNFTDPNEQYAQNSVSQDYPGVIPEDLDLDDTETIDTNVVMDLRQARDYAKQTINQTWQQRTEYRNIFWPFYYLGINLLDVVICDIGSRIIAFQVTEKTIAPNELIQITGREYYGAGYAIANCELQYRITWNINGEFAGEYCHDNPLTYSLECEPPQFTGGQCVTAYKVEFTTYYCQGGNFRDFSGRISSASSIGPFSRLELNGGSQLSYIDGDCPPSELPAQPWIIRGFRPDGSNEVIFALAQTATNRNGFTFDGFVRVDGFPDDCGDPPSKCDLKIIDAITGEVLETYEYENTSEGDFSFQNFSPPVEIARPIQIVPFPIRDGSAKAYLLDLPIIEEEDQDMTLYAAISAPTDSWEAGQIYIKRGDFDWQAEAVVTRSILGDCATTLGNAPMHNTDSVNSLQIVIESTSELTQLSTDHFYSLRNLAFVGREINGRYQGEIIAFKEATLINAEENRWEIRHLLRGLKGTGQFVSQHQSDELFVLLRGDGAYLTRLCCGEASDLGKTVQSRVLTLDTEGFAELPTESTVISGESMKPYPLHYFPLTADGDDLIIDLIRRPRRQNGLNEGFDVPVIDPPLIFEIEVLNSGIPVRLIRLEGETSYRYTGAEQVADFGAFQTSLTLRGCQIAPFVKSNPYTTTVKVEKELV